jgi:hypothetical protein
MRFHWPLVFVWALAPSLVSAQAGGSVSGHVVCADTRNYCRFAAVTLQSVESVASATSKAGAQQKKQAHYTGVTGLDGSYQINGVAPGDYYALAILPGYMDPYNQLLSNLPADTPLTQEALDKALTRVTVAANHLSSADITLQRGASLSGTVHFDDGSPAIGVSIALFVKDKNGQWKNYTNRSGNATFSSIGITARTDDRGRFYEPALPHGTYIVEVEMQEFVLVPYTITGSNGADMNDQRQGALRIFYGDKFRMKEAKPIELGEGEDRSDIDIAISTDGLHSVRGSVSSKNGESITHGEISLADPDDKTPLRTTEIQNDGSFSFSYLPSGAYQITIKANNGEMEFRPFTSSLVVDSDLPGLSYTVSPTRSNATNQ